MNRELMFFCQRPAAASPQPNAAAASLSNNSMGQQMTPDTAKVIFIDIKEIVIMEIIFRFVGINCVIVEINCHHGNHFSHHENHVCHTQIKCKNFLATLLRLASDQPESVARNVRGLIQV